MVRRVAGRSGGGQNPGAGNRANVPSFGVQKGVTPPGRKMRGSCGSCSRFCNQIHSDLAISCPLDSAAALAVPRVTHSIEFLRSSYETE